MSNILAQYPALAAAAARSAKRANRRKHPGRPRNGPVKHYKGRKSAARLFDSRADEVLLSGAAGTGKSRACLEKMHLMCLMNPGMKALIIRKTAVSLGSSALATYREHVASDALAVGDVWEYGGSASKPAGFIYKNGSTISYGGMDKPTKVMSTEYDLIYVQEAIELNVTDWEALTTRLRNGRVSFQQIMADTNPDRPDHWLKQRCDKGVCLLIDTTHEDNPRLYDEAGELTPEGRKYIGRLDNLTGVRKLRLRHGKWVGSEGLVYAGWDTSLNLVDAMPEGWESWPRIWGLDFGFTNPFVCQQWAVDPDGRLYLYREFYMTGMTSDDHAREILRVVAPDGTWVEPRPQCIVADHDAAARVLFGRVVGMSTTAAKKDVATGIECVQNRIKPAGDGQPRLFIKRNALHRVDPALVEACKPYCTEQEMLGYIWNATKDIPEKEDDHGMDTMRYVVAYSDLHEKAAGAWV